MGESGLMRFGIMDAGRSQFYHDTNICACFFRFESTAGSGTLSPTLTTRLLSA